MSRSWLEQASARHMPIRMSRPVEDGRPPEQRALKVCAEALALEAAARTTTALHPCSLENIQAEFCDLEP